MNPFLFNKGGKLEGDNSQMYMNHQAPYFYQYQNQNQFPMFNSQQDFYQGFKQPQIPQDQLETLKKKASL